MAGALALTACGGARTAQLRVTVDIGGVVHPGAATVLVSRRGQLVAQEQVLIFHSAVFHLPAGSYEVRESYRGRACLTVVDKSNSRAHTVPSSGAVVKLDSSGWNLTFLCDS